MMLNVLIVDDDPSDQELLQKYLQSSQGCIEIIDHVRTTALAMEVMERRKIDILFLDINLPFEDGIQFATRLNNSHYPVKIVFTTAFRNFAKQAIDLKPYDYLVKPFGPEEVKRILDHLSEAQDLDHEQPGYNSPGPRMDIPHKIKLRSKEGYFFENPGEIVLFRSVKNYSEAVYHHGQTKTIHYQLHQIHDITSEFNFIQINRSTIININYISRVNKKDRMITVRLKDEEYKYKTTKDKMNLIDHLQTLKIG